MERIALQHHRRCAAARREELSTAGQPTAVLFDLDDTLFDHAHCARTALDVIRGAHHCFSRIDLDELNRSHSIILEALHGEVAVGRLPLDAARTERFRRLFLSAGVEADEAMAAATAAAYRQAYLDSRRAVDGAADLLEALRPHARIGIVTNNLVAEQRAKLEHCGLHRYVDELIASEEAGVSKPDPAIFRMALDRLGVGAQAAVMIGDSWENDILGARAAGIRAVWFNPHGRSAADSDVPVLRSLTPVEEALRVIAVSRV